MKRGDVRERADVNYFLASFSYNQIYAHPKYPLTPIREIQERVQYGTSSLASTDKVGYPVLRMNNLQDEEWKLNDLKYIELSEKEFELYQLQAGDILFNRTNSKELVGKCAIFNEPGDWIFASYLMRLTVNEKASAEFVSAFLNTSAGRAQIDRVSRQIVGMSNVNAEELRDLLIPLPPLETQRALVNELESARTLRREQLARADALIAGLDAWLLEQLGLQTPAVETRASFGVKLGSIRNGRIDVGFNSPKSRALTQRYQEISAVPFEALIVSITKGETPLWRGDAYSDEGVNFLRAQNISSSGISGDLLRIDETVHERMKRSQLSGGELLYTMAGTIGIAALFSADLAPANINQAIAKIVLKEGVNTDYLLAVLNASVVRGQAMQILTVASQPNINFDQIKALMIPLPKVELQTQIAAEVRRRRDEAKQLRDEAQTQWDAAKARFEAQLLGGKP